MSAENRMTSVGAFKCSFGGDGGADCTLLKPVTAQKVENDATGNFVAQEVNSPRGLRRFLAQLPQSSAFFGKEIRSIDPP